MFVPLGKLLVPLLYPLGWSLALWVLAAVTYARGRGQAARWMAAAGAVLVLLAANPLLSDAFIGSLEDDYPTVSAAAAPVADAVVV